MASEILDTRYNIRDCDIQIIKENYCIEIWSCWMSNKDSKSDKILVRVVRHGSKSSLFIDKFGDNLIATLVQ